MLATVSPTGSIRNKLPAVWNSHSQRCCDNSRIGRVARLTAAKCPRFGLLGRRRLCHPIDWGPRRVPLSTAEPVRPTLTWVASV